MSLVVTGRDDKPLALLTSTTHLQLCIRELEKPVDILGKGGPK